VSEPHPASLLPGFGLGPLSRRPLRAATVSVAALDEVTRRAAFTLFTRLYEGVDRARFERDLAEKQLAIVLRDRESGALKGFSTVALSTVATRSRSGTVVFSGDTAVEQEYWGHKLLHREFARLLLRLKGRSPARPVYWFLISKGYRTYLLLANAFSRAIPRYDRADHPGLRALLDRLASERFGSQYDPATGLIRYSVPHERVRPGVAPLDPSLLGNPHIRFFADRNQLHANGTELACLAEARWSDLARAAGRIALARTRLRWNSR
jgi:hypothetical protein